VSYIIKNPGIVWDLLLEHLQMTSLALLIAVLVALPLSLITRYRWLSVPVLGSRNALHGAEPSVDYSAGAFIRPQLKFSSCGDGDLCSSDFGAQHHSGAINPAILEAARGMGMNPWQRWWRVQVP